MEIVYHPRYLEHRQFGQHPECPERLEAIMGFLELNGLTGSILEPGPIDESIVEEVHEPEFLDILRGMPEGHIDPDTFIREETYEIALLAAGGTHPRQASSQPGNGL